MPSESQPNTPQLDDALAARIATLSPAKRALLEKRLRERRAETPVASPPAIQPIPPRPAGTAPLSIQQKHHWVFAHLKPDSVVNNRPTPIQLTGPLDVDALMRAVHHVIQRHETLRATFIMVDGQPVQVIAPTLTIDIPLVDYSDLPVDEARARLEEQLRIETHFKFDLAEGPLVRAILYRLNESDHVLMFMTHHIIFDGWSVAVLLRDLSTFYEAEVSGQSADLPPLTAQYADYAVWQQQQMQTEAYQAQVDYWRKLLDPPPTPNQLSPNYARSARATYTGAVQMYEFSPDIIEAMRELGQKNSATLFMAMLTAFYILIHRYTGETTIVVGSPTSHRNHPDLEKLIGYFVNVLVLRVDLSGDPSFETLLARVRAMALEAYAHQDVQEETLIELLRPDRVGSIAAFHQIMFNFESLPLARKFMRGEMQFTEYPFARAASLDDLELEIVVRGREYVGEFTYNTELFSATTIDRFVNHYRTLLASILQNPQAPISTLSMLTEAERQTILTEWQGEQTEYPRHQTIHGLFAEAVARTPEATAVIFEDQTLTFRELDERSTQLAYHLLALGVGEGTIVGYCMEPAVDMLVGILGVLKAGGAYLPLDPAYPAARLTYMLENSSAQLIVTQAKFAERFAGDTYTTICPDADWATIAQAEPTPLPTVTADQVAYVMYTSGSSGVPKGVQAMHRGAVNRFYWMWREYPFVENEVGCLTTSISFVDSIWQFFGYITHNVPLVIVRREAVLDLSVAFETLRKTGVTRLVSVPSLLATMLDVVDDLHAELPQMKHVSLSGEPLSEELSTRLLKAMPHVRVLNLYGTSELAADVICYEITAPGRVYIGRPVHNTDVFILDKARNLVPVGVPGEVYVGGDNLARGYLNRPDLTDQAFLPHPFKPGERVYKTGDLARYMPDGNIDYLGRVDNQVKIRGFRIDVEEVQMALAPYVQHVYMHGWTNQRQEVQLVAYIVEAEDNPVSTDELRQILARQLPDFMVPALFVTMDEFPLMPNGKINYRALPAPDSVADEAGRTVVPPHNEVETQLVTIWEDVLDVRPIGIRDDFFALGGHSLLAVRLMAQIEKTFGHKLPLAELFYAPTIAELAQLLDDSERHSALLVPMQPMGSKRPLFCVHGVGGNVLGYQALASYLGPERPVYGLQAIGLDGQQPPLVRIEEMAVRYIQEMQRVQPTGPYHISGVSFGGFVAYEIARQLHLKGEQVGVVTIFDAVPRIDVDSNNAMRLLRRIVYNTRLGVEQVRKVLTLPYVEKKTYIQWKMTIFNQRKQRKIWQGAYLQYAQTDASFPTELQDVEQACWLALAEYTPEPSPVQVTFFKAETEKVRRVNPVVVWRKLALGGVVVDSSPGEHLTMIREPNAKPLSRKLARYLDEYDADR